MRLTACIAVALTPNSQNLAANHHAVGAQANFILPAKHVALFLKYEEEYLAKSRVRGHTIAFGGSWTVGVPKPAIALATATPGSAL